MSKSLSFYNLTGGLNTAQDLITINSTPNRTESPDMLNVEYYKLGGIQTMKGNKEVGKNNEYKNTDVTDIICGIEYNIENDSYMVVADREGYIYQYDKEDNKFKAIPYNGGFLRFTPVEVVVGTRPNPDDPEHPIVDKEFDYDWYEKERIYAVSYNNGIVFVNGKEALFYHAKDSSLNNVWEPKLQMDETITIQKTVVANDAVTDPNTEIALDDAQAIDPTAQVGDTVGVEEIVPMITTIHPVVVSSYKGRLFFGANNCTQTINGESTEYEGGMLFYSGVGLGIEETWYESANIGDDAGAFTEFFEDSSDFTGLGTWSEYLVIHKVQNTYLLDGQNSLASEWELKPYSEYTIPSQQSYVIANNGYYSYLPETNAIQPLLSRSIYNTTYQGGDISVKIKDTFDLLDSSQHDKIYAVFNSKKQYIMFYMPMLNGNGSNNCYIYDMNTKSWLHRRVPQYVTCAFKYNNEVYIGVRDNGEQKVLKEFTGKTFDGTSIEFYYVTPPFVWGGGTNKTTTKEFRIKLINSGANHFYVESYKDGLQDTKEQRLVKNVSDNLDGLIWDVGLSKDDKLWDTYVKVDGGFYRYDVDGTYYYTKTSSINNKTKVYATATPHELSDDEDNPYYSLDNLIGSHYYFYHTHLKPATESQYDTMIPDDKPSYAWNLQEPGSFCYKYGDYYAWVDQTTGECDTNLHYEGWYKWYGITLTGDGDPQHYRVSQTILDSINTYLNKEYHYWSMRTYPDDIQYLNPITNKWVQGEYMFASHPAFSELYTMWISEEGGGKYTDDGLNSRLYVKFTNQFEYIQKYEGNNWKNKSKIPSSVWDKDNNPDSVYRAASKKDNEVPKGTEPLHEILKGTKPIGNQPSITITVKIKGVNTNITLERYPDGDMGKVTGDVNYYTKTTKNGVTIVYTDSECTQQFTYTGTISGNKITMDDVDHTKYTRYPQGDGIWKDPKYYNFVKLTDYKPPDNINGVDIPYEYPPDNSPLWNQSLTDTVWDYTDTDVKGDYFILANRPATAETLIENEREGYAYEDMSIPHTGTGEAWLAQGYLTKRMLLPNQYFETVQFKFMGGGISPDGEQRYADSICIGGFEVDGVQLAETPWK